MKKLLVGAMIFGAFSTAAMAAPRGTVEFGFEHERLNTAFDDSSFILPYMSTKTYFNETTPLFVEAKYSFKYNYKQDSQKRDKRDRYELYFGGYNFKTENFAFTPKAGVRYNNYSNKTNGIENETEWRFYPNMSYKFNEKNGVSLGGFIGYVNNNSTGDYSGGVDSNGYDKEFTSYKHEFLFLWNHKLNDKQTVKLGVYNEFVDVPYSSEVTIWEARGYFNHKFDNAKTDVTAFVRLPLNREIDYDAAGKNDVNMSRQRYGISANHKVSNDWTMIGETWYQIENASGTSKDKKNWFTKLAMRYTY